MTQRILAIDDEIHMLRLLQRIVTEKTPYDIVTTNSSVEALAILERETFDLIITDLKMPGVDGIDILRTVKERQRQEEVIILTAFGSLESAIEALSKDVFDYITKPFKKEQIIFSVDKAMRWQVLRRESERIADVFGHEPYAEAEPLLQAEYVRRLAERCGHDATAIAERSGLDVERVRAALSRTDAP